MHPKETILRNFIEDIWNKKSISKVAQYVHSQYKIFLDTADPWEGQELSHTTFIERLHHSFDAFPDMHFEITAAIPEENHVAISWILSGTNLGEIANFAPTHKKIKTTGMTIYHFKENLICGHTQVFDRATVSKQLGFS